MIRMFNDQQLNSSYTSSSLGLFLKFYLKSLIMAHRSDQHEGKNFNSHLGWSFSCFFLRKSYSVTISSPKARRPTTCIRVDKKEFQLYFVPLQRKIERKDDHASKGRISCRPVFQAFQIKAKWMCSHCINVDVASFCSRNFILAVDQFVH